MASKENGEWQAPNNTAAAGKSGKGQIKFTARTAGAFFLLSALLEMGKISIPVSLFGSDYMGPIAVSYHLLFILLYLGMGSGLWTAKSWGLPVMLAGQTDVQRLQSVQASESM